MTGTFRHMVRNPDLFYPDRGSYNSRPHLGHIYRNRQSRRNRHGNRCGNRRDYCGTGGFPSALEAAEGAGRFVVPVPVPAPAEGQIRNPVADREDMNPLLPPEVLPSLEPP